jgi:hypothetical protein
MQSESPFHKNSPPEENRLLGRPILRWQDITKVGFNRIDLEAVGNFI